MKYCYTVVLDKDPEEGVYTVTVPALPGCITEGDSVEESLEMVKEAIALYIESLFVTSHVPGPDVEEIHLHVAETDEILICKVEVELEPELVETP